MAELHDKKSGSLWPWWPLFLGGLLGPFLGRYLQNWLAPHLAVAVAFFLAWVLVGLWFLRVPPRRAWRFSRWILGGAVGALIAGAVTFLIK